MRTISGRIVLETARVPFLFREGRGGPSQGGLDVHPWARATLGAYLLCLSQSCREPKNNTERTTKIPSRGARARADARGAAAWYCCIVLLKTSWQCELVTSSAFPPIRAHAQPKRAVMTVHAGCCRRGSQQQHDGSQPGPPRAAYWPTAVPLLLLTPESA